MAEVSVHQLLQAALQAACRNHAPLAGGVTAIFDAPPVRSAPPYAVITESVLTDWGAKGLAGREARVAVSLHDIGERPVRLRALMSAAEDALAEMPRAIGEGWTVVTLILLRSRIVRESEGRWIATSEFRVRMLRSEL